MEGIRRGGEGRGATQADAIPRHTCRLGKMPKSNLAVTYNYHIEAELGLLLYNSIQQCE